MIRKDAFIKNQNSRVLVVHLARQADGIVVFRRFVTSYRKHPAGAEHDLLIVFKGFSDDLAAQESWKSELASIEYCAFFVKDVDFDIGTYCRVAERYPERPLLVLNSNSELLVDNWLELFVRHANNHVLVGATGSWENSFLFSVMPGHRWLVNAVLRVMLSFVNLMLRIFEWPNPHLRTNAILFPAGFFNLIQLPQRLTNKMQAYACESGLRSISRQARKLGFHLLVADCNGNAYSWKEWPESLTFRMGEQEGLVVDDKQTRSYVQAKADERAALSKLSWGSVHSVKKH